MEIFSLIILGLSLSVDAFSLSLAYGLLNIPKKKIIISSLTVGALHFIMPILGNSLASFVKSFILFDSKFILILVLMIILIEMLKPDDKIEVEEMNLIGILIFSFLVSFDSFSLGLGIKYITHNIYLASTIFALLSGIFTYLGFTLGSFLYKELETKSKIVGIILISITIVYFLCK